MIAAELEQPQPEVPDIDAYEHRVCMRKAKAIAYGMGRRKDKKAAAHYLIKTLKVAMATAPSRRLGNGDQQQFGVEGEAHAKAVDP